MYVVPHIVSVIKVQAAQSHNATIVIFSLFVATSLFFTPRDGCTSTYNLRGKLL